MNDKSLSASAVACAAVSPIGDEFIDTSTRGAGRSGGLDDLEISSSESPGVDPSSAWAPAGEAPSEVLATANAREAQRVLGEMDDYAPVWRAEQDGDEEGLAVASAQFEANQVRRQAAHAKDRAVVRMIQIRGMREWARRPLGRRRDASGRARPRSRRSAGCRRRSAATTRDGGSSGRGSDGGGADGCSSDCRHRDVEYRAVPS